MGVRISGAASEAANAAAKPNQVWRLDSSIRIPFPQADLRMSQAAAKRFSHALEGLQQQNRRNPDARVGGIHDAASWSDDANLFAGPNINQHMMQSCAKRTVRVAQLMRGRYAVVRLEYRNPPRKTRY